MTNNLFLTGKISYKHVRYLIADLNYIITKIFQNHFPCMHKNYQ